MSNSSIHAHLQEALKVYSRRDLAVALEINTSTLSRWINKENEPKPYVLDRLKSLLHPQRSQLSGSDFTFIDLFAGIGGLRMAFEKIGGHCVFTSEWNPYSQRTYRANFHCEHEIAGDITKVAEHEIPDHDVLLAGFPCQPFSLAGVSKKNSLGRLHGFACDTQGTLFFDVARIIAAKQPKAFLLENVKNLKSHDGGNTYRVIMHTLQQELGYHIHVKIIDGAKYVPQHRERIVIVGFRENTPFSWDAIPPQHTPPPTMSSILHNESSPEPYLEWDGSRYFDHEAAKVLDKYTLSTKLWQFLRDYKQKHEEKGNGFGFGLVGPNDRSRTLSARYHKDGSEILVSRGGRKRPRRLTPRECARLMGYPDDFRIPVSDTRAYQQFGNSVVVPAFLEVAKIMKPYLGNNEDIADLLTAKRRVVA